MRTNIGLLNVHADTNNYPRYMSVAYINKAGIHSIKDIKIILSHLPGKSGGNCHDWLQSVLTQNFRFLIWWIARNILIQWYMQAYQFFGLYSYQVAEASTFISTAYTKEGYLKSCDRYYKGPCTRIGKVLSVDEHYFWGLSFYTGKKGDDEWGQYYPRRPSRATKTEDGKQVWNQ